MKKSKKFLKYVIFAILSSSINVLVYYFLYYFFHFNVVICNFFAYAISIGVQFLTNKKYVFKNEDSDNFKKFMMFLMVKVVAFIIDTIVLIVCTRFFKWNHFISKIISNASTTISNYSLNDKFVFKNK